MDTIQPSSSCLTRIPGAIIALRTVLGSHTPRATRELAQCLFHAKRLAQAKSDNPRVIIEYAGSEARLVVLSYSDSDTALSLLNRLALRLLGDLGEMFVAYDLCKKPMPDQSADKLYEALAPTTCLSSMAQADRLYLQLVVKPNPTDEDKVSFINEALRQTPSDEQLLRILEIIGQIGDRDLRLDILNNNIQQFLNVPYLNITTQITDTLWKDDILNAIAIKLIPNNLEKALKITQLITDTLWKDEIFKAIALKFLEENDIERALEFARQITDVRYKYEIFKAIVLEHIKESNFKEAHKIVQQITLIPWKDPTLKAVALKLLERNDIERALEFAQQITLPPWKNPTLKAIALKFLEGNDIKRALEFAQQITYTGYKDEIFKAIAKKRSEKNVYMMSIVSKILKFAVFAILSLITYRLIASIRNSPPLQLTVSSSKVKT